MSPGLARTSLWVSMVALLVPVALAPVPPLLDFPNHLARLWLLGGGAALPPVSGWYQVRWDTLTNVGIDIVGSLGVRLVGLVPTGQALVGLAVVLPPLGGVLLFRAVHAGERHHAPWWPVAFGLLAWGMGLLAGFLNFQIALGIALLCAACDPALARRGTAVQLVVRAMFAALLILVHVFGFVFYAALLAGLALGPSLSVLRLRAWPGLAHRLLWAVVALAIPAALFVWASPSLPGQQAGAGLGSMIADFAFGFARWRDAPLDRLSRAAFIVQSYATKLDVLAAAGLIAPPLLSAVSGRLRVHAGLLLASVALWACFALFPDRLAGTYFIDTRFAEMAPFALAAAVLPAVPRWAAGLCLAGLLGSSLLRTGVMGWTWHARQADVASVAAALAVAEPGRTILPVEHRSTDRARGPFGRYFVNGENSYRHLSALAVPWRQDFVPILFASRGKQPIEVIGPAAAYANAEGIGSANITALDDEAGAEAERVGFVRGWRERYDYVLVLNSDGPEAAAPVPKGLTLLRDAGFARLYGVTRPAGGF